MSATRSFGHSLDQLLARCGVGSMAGRPPALQLARRDDRVMLAEILIASAVLEMGDIPVDLLSRCRSDDRKTKRPKLDVTHPRRTST